MRILHVATFCHPDHFGGAERVISAVVRGLAARGHAVTLLTGTTADQPAHERSDGVDIVRYSIAADSPAHFYRSVWRGVRRALSSGVGADADVLHVHQFASGLAALAPGGARTVPRVLSFYAPYHLEYLARHRDGRGEGSAPTGPRALAWLLRSADRYLLRRCPEILALSEFSRGQIRELLPAAAERTTVVPPGVDLERFRPAADARERAACRATLGLPDDEQPLLLSVRRLVPRMGLPDLLEGLALLAKRGLAARLAVAGDGEQRADLLEQTRRAELGARVTWLGRVADQDLPNLYRAADVFVLPTRSLEGFGMATAEALASGLPIVATRVGATAEVLARLPGCRLVPPGNPPALAEALAPFVVDPSARRHAGVAARAHAVEHLGWTDHLDAVERASRRVAATPR